MVIDIPIDEIMTHQVISIDLFEGLEKAETMMRKHHIRHLPVLKEGNLVGMLSLTDLQRISFANSFYESTQNEDSAIYEMFTIEQIMTHHPISIDIKEGIPKALQILAEKEFHALPIVSKDKLVGIVTSTDIIKYFMKVCEI